MSESPDKTENPTGAGGAPPPGFPAPGPYQGAAGGYPPPYPYQPGPYPGGYPPPPPQPYAGYGPLPTGPKNGLGTSALVVAIIGLVFCWSVFGGVVLGVVAVVMGFVAHGRVKRGEADNGGVAIAGIVLGFISIIAGLAFIAIWVGVFNEVGGGDYLDCVRSAGQDQQKVNACVDQFRDHMEDKFSVTVTPTP
jgi:hypothetical protein